MAMMRKRSRLRPRHSADHNGFTLAETLVALFVLAFAATLIGQLVRISMASEQRTAEAIKNARAVGLAIRAETELIADDEVVLNLSNSKPTLTANCLYDVVGRRCR